jgi:hypothetical protein
VQVPAHGRTCKGVPIGVDDGHHGRHRLQIGSALGLRPDPGRYQTPASVPYFELDGRLGGAGNAARFGFARDLRRQCAAGVLDSPPGGCSAFGSPGGRGGRRIPRAAGRCGGRTARQGSTAYATASGWTAGRVRMPDGACPRPARGEWSLHACRFTPEPATGPHTHSATPAGTPRTGDGRSTARWGSTGRSFGLDPGRLRRPAAGGVRDTGFACPGRRWFRHACCRVGPRPATASITPRS